MGYLMSHRNAVLGPFVLTTVSLGLDSGIDELFPPAHWVEHVMVANLSRSKKDGRR